MIKHNNNGAMSGMCLLDESYMDALPAQLQPEYIEMLETETDGMTKKMHYINHLRFLSAKPQVKKIENNYYKCAQLNH